MESQNKELVVLSACGSSRGVVIMWDLDEFNCLEMTLRSFLVTIKFVSNVEGTF